MSWRTIQSGFDLLRKSSGGGGLRQQGSSNDMSFIKYIN